jgi:heptosyltransferase III
MPNSIDRLQIRLAQMGLILSHPFGQFSRPQLPAPPNPQSILIIRLDHLGDLVMSQPAIAAIRSHYPKAIITLLCASWNITIAAMIPGLDEVITIDAPWHRGGDGWKAVRRFLADNKSRRFDIGIALRQWLGDLWLLSRMNCSYRLGYSMVGIKPRLSYAAKLLPDPIHASDLALNLLTILGVPTVPGTTPELTPTAKGEEEAQAFMAEHGLAAGQFFSMHIESRQQPRSWSMPEAVKLGGKLWDKYSFPAVLLGGKDEEERYDRLTSGHDYLINAAGKLSLPGSFSLLKRVKAFVGVDSGPAHLAAAADIPTLVLWSGQVPSYKTMPRGKAVKVIQNQCRKAPCYEPTCPFPDTPCMTSFTADTVLNELELMIS